MSHSYVAEYKSTLKSSSAMFTVQQLEQETGVSFQDWKVDTVNDLVKRLQADNYYLNRGKLTEIKGYLDYLLKKNVITPQQHATHPFFFVVCNDDKEIKRTYAEVSDDKILRKFFFSEQEFADYLDALCPGVSYSMSRAIMILAWIGLDKGQILNVKKKDYHQSSDHSSAYIEFLAKDGMKQLLVPKRFVSDIERAVKSDQETVYNGACDGLRQLNYNPEDDDFLIRATVTGARVTKKRFDPITGDRIYCSSVQNISRFITNQCKKLTYDNPFKQKDLVTLRSITNSNEFINNSQGTGAKILTNAYRHPVYQQWLQVKELVLAE